MSPEIRIKSAQEQHAPVPSEAFFVIVKQRKNGSSRSHLFSCQGEQCLGWAGPFDEESMKNVMEFTLANTRRVKPNLSHLEGIEDVRRVLAENGSPDLANKIASDLMEIIVFQRNGNHR